MRISDWSADVCSSDLTARRTGCRLGIVPQAADSLDGERVDGRRAQDRVAGGAERIAAPLVSGDQQDVGSHRRWLPEQRSLPTFTMLRDRQSVVSGTSGSVRVDLGGRRIIKKKQ